MASASGRFGISFLILFMTLLVSSGRGQLSSSFYSETCPILPVTVSLVTRTALFLDPSLGASMLRLFFHDCFVNGCDGSVLLDDDGNFVGEKNAGPNANSLRGFEVVDTIKAAVEIECPQTVSCADILALAARESVALLGGPSWALGLGRRDSTTASLSGANSDLPSPASSIPQLVSAFAAKGLSARDMTALSGAHTVGQARCVNFRDHVNGDANIDASFAEQRRRSCPASGGDGNLAPLDEQTAGTFDNAYFQNLLEFRGLLHSDQVLYSNGTQESSLVQLYASDPSAFEADFAAAMVKMSNLSPLTGNSGEIRMNCRSVN
ncbi:peroxidase P7-like [Zingiber officinale]|uniref:peroxidase P7-like n=1 Tax=Zingiber officinale TaxID=94328 RepID=UPI001C4CBB59|nr:peroxidase P7-like [Zingiber officinale]